MTDDDSPARTLVSHDGTGMKIDPDTLHWLTTLNEPMFVLAVVGPMRSGKSTLLNSLFGSTAFATSACIASCTRGIQVKRVSLADPESGDDVPVLLLDVEGFGSPEAHAATREAQLFALTALLSCVTLYNSFGLVDERAIQRLAALTSVASQLMEGTDGSTPGAAAHGRRSLEEMPKLVWLLRDFSFELSDDTVTGHT